MNLRDLRYVVTVAEQRHFGRAAELCHVSQPTLSGQIKKLEGYLGVAIFERTNKSVAVTPIGEEIVSYARRALELTERIEEIARAHRDPMSVPVRLGVIPTLSPYLMPLLLRPLRERFPRLKLVLSEELTDHLVRRLRCRVAGHTRR
jgi:LysR family hydrogen peroxide-inducible transcriptional activator